tara:strand:- start:1728 stop:2279 length:552 start_codon:yes stop_codon:yes gene_type:complete
MKVSNPLTIIAIFAGTAEAFAAVALVALPLEIQSIFVYFVMLFPLVIVLAFFAVLVLKPHVLYAPSDFDDQEHFLEVNSIRATIAEVTEKAMEVASASGQEIDPKTFSLKVAESTADRLESNLNEKIHRYLKEHPKEAFTDSGLGHIFLTSRKMAASSLQYLESIGLVVQGKDGDTTVWQVKQ